MMKTVMAAFRQFLSAIGRDAMLAACLAMPLPMAALLRWGVPALEGALLPTLGTAHVLAPYYGLIDLFLSMMVPLMFCFAGVMVILEELDDGTARYLMVTPLGRRGYLVSRLVILTALSAVYDVALLAGFSLSGMALWLNVLCALVNALVSVSVAMLVVGLARNKVEGMALIKLSGFFLLGYLGAYFLQTPLAYVAGVLPGYWLGRMVLEQNGVWALPAAVVACVWIGLFYRRFDRKISS